MPCGASRLVNGKALPPSNLAAFNACLKGNLNRHLKGDVPKKKPLDRGSKKKKINLFSDALPLLPVQKMWLLQVPLLT